MITTVNIDFSKLKSDTLNESFIAQWAADVKYVLKHVMSKPLFARLEEDAEEETKRRRRRAKPLFARLEEDAEEETKVVIKGAKDDVRAFVDTIKKEKEYALEYLENGLGAPALSDIKLDLETSINKFEKTTGLKWPLR